MRGIRVKSAGLKHLKTINRWNNALRKELLEKSVKKKAGWNPERWELNVDSLLETFLNGRGNRRFIAFDEKGKPVGMIGVTKRPCPVWYTDGEGRSAKIEGHLVGDAYVPPEHRGSGVVDALLKQVGVASAKDPDVQHIMAISHREDVSHIARKEAGWKKVGRIGWTDKDAATKAGAKWEFYHEGLPLFVKNVKTKND